ncbi:ABC transporter substrate-binding protein [Millisia brevis]|uniref:ABC transporter substrate-binding protein n=1 Tax=Millisia brevis TaxID=264148 RepID=UPI00082C3C08|nr:ABC transporter substrate-binding protein [Millisia brevis]
MTTVLRTRKRATVLSALALTGITVFSAACSSTSDTTDTSTSAEASATRTFDTGDEIVEIPADPQRIVACGYAVLPLIQSGANLSGICEWSRELDNMNDEDLATYESLPKLATDGDVSTLDYEAVIEVDPDLIIMGVPARAREMVNLDQLEAIAPVVFLGPTAPSQWRTLGVQYAEIANVADEYGAFQDEYTARAEEIRTQYADTLGSLTFGGVCDLCGTDPGTFFREYRSSYTTNLFDDLGLDFPGTPADPEDEHGEILSVENLSESLGSIDVIVYGVDADGRTSDELTALIDSPAWQALPAVAAGRIVEVKHGNAATFETALLALDSIDQGLAALPANQ